MQSYSWNSLSWIAMIFGRHIIFFCFVLFRSCCCFWEGEGLQIVKPSYARCMSSFKLNPWVEVLQHSKNNLNSPFTKKKHENLLRTNTHMFIEREKKTYKFAKNPPKHTLFCVSFFTLGWRKSINVCVCVCVSLSMCT